MLGQVLTPADSLEGARVDLLGSVVGRSEHTKHLVRFTAHCIAAAFSTSTIAKPANQEADIYPSLLSRGRGVRQRKCCNNWQPTLEHARLRPTLSESCSQGWSWFCLCPRGDQNSTPAPAVWASPSSAFASRDFLSVHDWPFLTLLVRSRG